MPRYDIVFDVGKVLIDFDLTRFQEFMLAQGAVLCSRAEFLERTNMHLFERGRITEQVFLEGILKLLPVPVTPETLGEQWCNMFVPYPEMFALLRTLRESGHRIFLLSNTNSIHWLHLEAKHGFSKFVDGSLTSYEAGAAKPEALIFETAEQKFKLVPGKIIFVDDIEEHIRAAEARGWKGIVHTSRDATVKKLLQFDITVPR